MINNSFLDKMSFSNNCFLCLKHGPDLFKIFGKRGTELNTGTILTEHFWFEVSESDKKSICEKCWWTVQNFHDFYHFVKLNHQHQSISEVKLVFIDANKHKEIVDLLETVKDEPNIDIDYCSSDIPNTLHSLDVSESCMESESVKSVVIEANEQNEIVDLLETVKDEPNIDIDDCPSDIRNTLHSLDVSESCMESESVKLAVIDANKYNKVVDLLETIKHEPNIDIKNYIDDCSSDIPGASESCMESKINRATDLPTIIRRKRPKTSVSPSTKTTTKKYKTDSHTVLLSTYFDMNCNLCGDALNSFRNTKKHYRTVHNVKNGYLICCSKKFIRLSQMLQHCQWHMNPNSFECDHCPRSYDTKDGLRIHMNHRHGPDNEKRFNCIDCEKIFLKEIYLRAHIKRRHSSQSSVDLKKAGNQITKPRSYTKRAHLNVNSHICEICAKSFVSRQTYEMHFITFHTNTSQKVQCDICGKWLKNKLSLMKHFYWHKSKPETCGICGRVCSKYGSLKNHMRTTHREASLKCAICGKMIKTRCALKEHMAIHAGITDLYKCIFCTKTFRSNGNMYAHRKREHPDELEQMKASLNCFTPETTE